MKQTNNTHKPHLVLQNLWVKLENKNAQLDCAIRELESTLSDGYGVQHVDGQRVLGGLVFDLAKNLDCTAVDSRTPPLIGNYILPEFLRPYQKQAVKAAVTKTLGIIHVPMGGGKTAIAAGLMSTIPVKWMYLVHKPGLVRQTAAALREFLKVPVGEVHGGARFLAENINCGTFESILNYTPAQKFLEQADGIIVDEVHRLPSKRALTCAMLAKNAYYRIGLSATPLMRGDKKDILTVGLTGPIIYSVSVDELVAQKFNTELQFNWHPTLCQTNASSQDFHKFYKETLVNFEDRNLIACRVAREGPKPAILFVKLHTHAKDVFKLLSSHHPQNKVRYVDGNVSAEERSKICKQMQFGEVEIVVATAVFYEGVDVPNIQHIIVATGCQSAIETIQRAGRGTRVAEGKNICYVTDFADRGHPTLEKHTLKRYEAYLAAGFKVPHPFPELEINSANNTPHINPEQYQGVRFFLWFCLCLIFIFFLGLGIHAANNPMYQK